MLTKEEFVKLYLESTEDIKNQIKEILTIIDSLKKDSADEEELQ